MVEPKNSRLSGELTLINESENKMQTAEMMRQTDDGYDQIEAHSKQDSLIGQLEGNANGIAFQSNSVTIRVKESGGVANYIIDRMD